MRIRKLLSAGVIASSAAAGLAGITAGLAEASVSCVQVVDYMNLYRGLADQAITTARYYISINDWITASGYYSQYENYSNSYHYWEQTSVNLNCNL
jgi:hypothetical protein